jgi:hypothetical protein
MEGICFYTRTKVITERWPSAAVAAPVAGRSTVMPTHG